MMAHNLCYTTLLRPGAAQRLGYDPLFILCTPGLPVSQLQPGQGREPRNSGEGRFERWGEPENLEKEVMGRPGSCCPPHPPTQAD